MKNAHHFGLIIMAFLAYNNCYAMQKDSHQEKLVHARLLWLGSEQRVALLIRDMPCTAPTAKYLRGTTHIAYLNSAAQTVTTLISPLHSISHSYDEFLKFLCDPLLYQEAYNRYQQANQLAVQNPTIEHLPTLKLNGIFFSRSFLACCIAISIVIVSMDICNALFH